MNRFSYKALRIQRILGVVPPDPIWGVKILAVPSCLWWLYSFSTENWHLPTYIALVMVVVRNWMTVQEFTPIWYSTKFELCPIFSPGIFLQNLQEKIFLNRGKISCVKFQLSSRGCSDTKYKAVKEKVYDPTAQCMEFWMTVFPDAKKLEA